MLILVLLLPAFGFFSGILFGRYIGRFINTITIIFIIFSFLLSLRALTEILCTNICYKLTFDYWLATDSISINWCLIFDSLTCVMLVVVTGISSLVHLFSIEYMKHDPHISRFMSYLSLFSFFMLILVTSSTFLQMFIGWEGVGLCSYLLINFWFTRIQANKSAIKAMLINRIGDFFILIVFFSIYSIISTLDYDVAFILIPFITNLKFVISTAEVRALDYICLFLLFGAMGKSAQIGFHTWLPDAMEGPTPVSALIHAATMVTAGVFLIARCSYIFEYSQAVLNIVTIVGCLTAFFAATTGLFQNDIKRIIAYSTCSQLGYMLFSCGLSGYEVGLFHLTNHAFFKALLFLSAGSIIHSMCDEQDIRNMGGLIKLIPFSYTSIIVGSLALTGFPFLSGFFSKDAILEVAFSKHSAYASFAFILGISGALCTCFYSMHLVILTFLSRPNGNKNTILLAQESNENVQLPLMFLVLLSIISGYLIKEIFIGFGTGFWNTSLLIKPYTYSVLDVDFISNFFKVLPMIVTLAGFIFAIIIYVGSLQVFFRLKIGGFFKKIYFVLIKKWYFDRIFNQFLSQKYVQICYYFSYKDLDKGLIEKLGPSGIINVSRESFFSLKHAQSGYIFHYLFFLLTISMLTILYVVSYLILKLPGCFIIFILSYLLFEI